MELDAAPYLIGDIDGLYTLMAQGRITTDDYHAALACVAPAVENGPRCLYCDKSAVIGQTCAAHADTGAAAKVAREFHPTVNLARYSTSIALTAAVIAALERTGRVEAARRFQERAKFAPGMNALCQMARGYVRLVSEVI